VHLDRVLVFEARLTGEPAHAIAAELLAHHPGLGGDDARGSVHQQLEHGPLGLLHARRVEHVQRPLGELLEHRFSQCLRWDRAGVDGNAAEALLALGDRNALAELGGLDGRLLAAWP
jgi:hypothetical protein